MIHSKKHRCNVSGVVMLLPLHINARILFFKHLLCPLSLPHISFSSPAPPASPSLHQNRISLSRLRSRSRGGARSTMCSYLRRGHCTFGATKFKLLIFSKTFTGLVCRKTVYCVLLKMVSTFVACL